MKRIQKVIRHLSVGTKIQLAISTNVVLAILIGEYIIYSILHFEGLLATLINVIINSVIAFCFGFYVSRAITEPLLKQVRLLEEMNTGRGDLTKRLDQYTNDEIGDLSGQFNQFVEHLLEMVKGISNGVQCMNSSIRYFNQTGHNIKSNAYLQSKQTDNMVTEIDTMSQTEHGIACDSEEAELIAQTSKESAEAGLHVVEQTINGMKFLSETVGQSSHQLQTLSSSFDTIDSFVVSINSIAEQTNLLALNAAIEAARAGNHGRGFAVVADEVRALATRTGQTTVEINKLINTMRSNMNDLVQALSSSIEQVTQGVALSQTAGETLQEIVEHSQEVAEKIHKIKYKVNHQLDIADKVKTEVNTIAKLAHQNGDAVAQVVNFSEQLSQQMDSIQHIVDDFKIQ